MKALTAEESRDLATKIRFLTPIQKSDFYFYTIIEGKDPFEFLDSLNVTKHGHHDQSSHGSWAHGGGDNSIKNFKKAVDEAYGTGEESFSIAHTGDDSTSALGTYLAKGHVINDNIRAGKMDEYLTDTKQVKDVVAGLDNAIEMAPRMPHQKLWRTASADAVLGLKKGAIYEDKGFSSTTAVDITHPDNGKLLLTLATVSSGRKALMKIDTGSVGKGIYIPKMFPGQPIAEMEHEFLLPRNTKMKYLGPDYVFTGDGSNVLEIHRFKVVG